MADLNLITKLGWLPDWPDFRDKTEEDDQISPRLSKLGQTQSIKKMKSRLAPTGSSSTALPVSVNLSQWFPPVDEHQEEPGIRSSADVWFYSLPIHCPIDYQPWQDPFSRKGRQGRWRTLLKNEWVDTGNFTP